MNPTYQKHASLEPGAASGVEDMNSWGEEKAIPGRGRQDGFLPTGMMGERVILCLRGQTGDKT